MYTRNRYSPKVNDLIEMGEKLNALKKDLGKKGKNLITIDKRDGTRQNGGRRVNYHIDSFSGELSQALLLAEDQLATLEDRVSRSFNEMKMLASPDIGIRAIPEKIHIEYLSFEKLLSILEEKIKLIPSGGFGVSNKKKNRKK